jgi:hypothetical protein
MKADASAQDGRQKTWNDPDQIAEHRRMTVEQRVLRAIELSRAALRMTAAKRVGGDDR